MKQCAQCRKFRIEQEFGNNKLTLICKPCRVPEREQKPTIKKYRKYALKSFYGMSLEDYDNLLLKQFGRCAICGSTDPKARAGHFHVDHSTETGKVRGLLCNPCNTALGLLKENQETLQRAIVYLEYNSPKNTQQEVIKLLDDVLRTAE